MCRYGDTVPVEVTAPGGERTTKQIDSCMADIVRALDAAGIIMQHSCCGHGKGRGDILVADGRTLIVQPEKWRQKPVSECTQREGHKCRALIGARGGLLRCQRFSSLGYGQRGCAIERAMLDSQLAGERLAALVEGLSAEVACCEAEAVSAERRGATGRARAFAECLDHLDTLLREPGFAPEAEVPSEAAQDVQEGPPGSE